MGLLTPNLSHLKARHCKSAIQALSVKRERDMFPQNPVYSNCPWLQQCRRKPCGYQPE